MFLELKPAQQRVLDRVAQSRMGPEDVLDQEFAVIRGQFGDEGWLLEERSSIIAQVEEGFSQAQRGELVGGEQAAQILRDRRSKER